MSARKPISLHYIGDLHAYKSLTLAGGALTNSVLKTAAPTKAGVDLPVSGAGLEYRLEEMHISLDAATTLTLTDGTTAIWGPHACPEGFGKISFPTSPDKTRTGKRCGANKSLYLTTSAGVNGEIEVFGYLVPST